MPFRFFSFWKILELFKVPMPVDLDNVSTASGEASVSSSGNQTVPPKPTTKKKRNLPGMPGTTKDFVKHHRVAFFFSYFVVCGVIQIRMLRWLLCLRRLWWRRTGSCVKYATRVFRGTRTFSFIGGVTICRGSWGRGRARRWGRECTCVPNRHAFTTILLEL